jgi:hypothetical protein
LRQQLLERSKKYLLSIENNQSFSPELKKRLVLQSQKVIESGLRKLSNTSVARSDLLQPANGQVNTAFVVNALNKIGNNAAQNQQNGLRTLEFLRGNFLCAIKVYVPTIYEVVLRVALPDDIGVVNRVRIFFRRDVNIESPLCRFIFGAIGCGEIISTTSRSRDAKSFAKLLAKNVISITAPQLTNTNFSLTTIFTDKITATSILVAETVILRN